MKHPIDLILCDIEMPGENGLELNEWVKERYPNVVHILLSSHTDFSYALSSLKRRCFDYIVQPAPFDEIEECLRRAVKKIYADREDRKLLDYGRLYISGETELNSSFVFGLYSPNPDNVKNSMRRVNDMGYPLAEESEIQIILYDFYSYSAGEESGPSVQEIQLAITDTFKRHVLDEGIYALFTQNRYKQFVLLLFTNQPRKLPCAREKYENMYRELNMILQDDITCYVGEMAVFRNIREAIRKVHYFGDNNVSRRSGLYYVNNQEMQDRSIDFSEHMKKWEFLLEDYQYNDYMDSFKNVDSIREAVIFIANALEQACKGERGKNDVEKAKDYIMNNISKNITVSDVSAYVHLSPDLELGYTNFSHFTQLFKKFENTTPSEYRKKLFQD